MTKSLWSSCSSLSKFYITAFGKVNGEPINSRDTVSLSSVAYGCSYRRRCLLSSHHFYWKGRNSWISKTNLNVKMFGWGKLIFVDLKSGDRLLLKWNKYTSWRNFQRNFKFCNYLYWMSMRNNEQWTAFRCRSILITITAARLAQFYKRRSAEGEAVCSSPGRTKGSGSLNNWGESAAFVKTSANG